MNKAIERIEHWRTSSGRRAWSMVSPDRIFGRDRWGVSLFEDTGGPAMEKLLTAFDDSLEMAIMKALGLWQLKQSGVNVSGGPTV